jgi:hypothetical protein
MEKNEKHLIVIGAQKAKVASLEIRSGGRYAGTQPSPCTSNCILIKLRTGSLHPQNDG